MLHSVSAALTAPAVPLPAAALRSPLPPPPPPLPPSVLFLQAETMARQRQQRKGLLQQLAALLAGFASACKTLLEAALEWWRGVPPPEPADPLLDASSKASRAERRAAAKAAAAAAAGGSKARAPQPPSESESSDEEEAPPAPAAPGSGFAAFATVEPGAWRAVGGTHALQAAAVDITRRLASHCHAPCLASSPCRLGGGLARSKDQGQAGAPCRRAQAARGGGGGQEGCCGRAVPRDMRAPRLRPASGTGLRQVRRLQAVGTRRLLLLSGLPDERLEAPPGHLHRLIGQAFCGTVALCGAVWPVWPCGLVWHASRRQPSATAAARQRSCSGAARSCLASSSCPCCPPDHAMPYALHLLSCVRRSIDLAAAAVQGRRMLGQRMRRWPVVLPGTGCGGMGLPHRALAPLRQFIGVTCTYLDQPITACFS